MKFKEYLSEWTSADSRAQSMGNMSIETKRRIVLPEIEAVVKGSKELMAGTLTVNGKEEVGILFDDAKIDENSAFNIVKKKFPTATLRQTRSGSNVELKTKSFGVMLQFVKLLGDKTALYVLSWDHR